MKSLIIIMVVVLLFSVSVWAISPEEIKTLKDYTAVVTQQYQGSGVFISENHIITCAHLFTFGIDKVSIKIDGVEIIGNLIKKSIDIDLALVEISGKHSYVQLETEWEVGQEIYIISAPYGIEDTLFYGRIANFYRNDLLFDAKVMPGTSGGGIFNLDGKLLGIITAYYGEAGDSLGIAITARTILDFLK